MTRLLPLFLLLGRLGAARQSIDSVSTITFRYNNGHYSFGNSGRHAFTEILEYKKTTSGRFLLTSFLQLHKLYDSTNNKMVIDTMQKQTGARGNRAANG